MKTEGIKYPSADGKHEISGYIYSQPDIEPSCILQISHGMCEYIGRYEDFAGYLSAVGVVVCGNDHLGHGDSVFGEDDYGYFSGTGGHIYVLEDLNTMNRIVRERYPQLPLILLGHSMGSFFARRYAVLWPETIDGLIISGTGGPNPATGAGIRLSKILGKFKGDRHRSQLMKTMAFGSYFKRIKNPKSVYDWVSTDEVVVKNYANDPKCNFSFTVNGYGEMLTVLRDVSGPQWAEAIPKDMPVLLIAGEEDPVGAYGKGVETVYGWLKDAGVRKLDLKLYPGMRHEVLNEVERGIVYSDTLEFIKSLTNSYTG